MYKTECYGKGNIWAKVVAASIANTHPIITFEVHFPRFILPQVLTHRVFSRNTSSSRAIPTNKLIEAAIKNPALPIYWGANKPGMQAEDSEVHQVRWYSYYEGCWLTDTPETLWGDALENILPSVNGLIGPGNPAFPGVHKQIANRLLEPFLFTKMIITTTELDNFFSLRLSDEAQPEIQELARCMKAAMEECEYTQLNLGDWHLPYVLDNERNAHNALAISAGRCARVSFDNIHSNKSPVELYNTLLKKKHKSPFEHQATPMIPHATWEVGVTHIDRQGVSWSGNFRNWLQHRQLLGESHDV